MTTPPKTRLPYSQEEDDAIQKYITDHELHSKCGGTTFWKVMEQKNITNRTWQSMKARYIHHIAGRSNTHIHPLSETQRGVEKRGNEHITDGSPRKRRSVKGYTQSEDMSILKYVERYGRGRCKGKNLWVDMEMKKVTARSWQSMRDRYLQHLRNEQNLKEEDDDEEPQCGSTSVTTGDEKAAENIKSDAVRTVNNSSEASASLTTDENVISGGASSDSDSDSSPDFDLGHQDTVQHSRIDYASFDTHLARIMNKLRGFEKIALKMDV